MTLSLVSGHTPERVDGQFAGIRSRTRPQRRQMDSRLGELSAQPELAGSRSDRSR
jgi:hypothetical protein